MKGYKFYQKTPWSDKDKLIPGAIYTEGREGWLDSKTSLVFEQKNLIHRKIDFKEIELIPDEDV